MPREVLSRVIYKFSCASRNIVCFIDKTSRHFSARVRATSLQSSNIFKHIENYFLAANLVQAVSKRLIPKFQLKLKNNYASPCKMGNESHLNQEVKHINLTLTSTSTLL